MVRYRMSRLLLSFNWITSHPGTLLISIYVLIAVWYDYHGFFGLHQIYGLRNDTTQSDPHRFTHKKVKFEEDSDNWRKKIHFTTKWRTCDGCQHFIYTEDAEKHCPRCIFTENPSDFNSSDAVVFHGRYLENIPKFRDPKQIWIYMLFESPITQRDANHSKAFKDAFNWTMTYRKDSDIFSPYGGFEKRSKYPVPPATDHWAYHLQNREHEMMRTPSIKDLRKKKLVAWISSRCTSWGQREDIVERMQKYIPVSIYGNCGNLRCASEGIEDCKFQIASKYKFYLAFENAVCQDYVTEKYFSTLLTEMIPVVYGGANYSALFPPKSFINLADFKSIKDLTKYLTFLGNNPKEYLKYFNWRKNYWVYNNRFTRGWCKICDRLWELDSNTTTKNNNVYKDITKWWNMDSSGKKLACLNSTKMGWKILKFLKPREDS